MKNTLKLFALVAFMFAAFATSAQTAKPIKLGHLDVQKVMTSMPEFKKAQDDLAAKEQEIRKELTAMHENYQKLMQEYQANAKTLTELSR
ncbi:MAG: OmpH family outer membrane protein, partial [Butyricimonas paravirosa]